jgi:hypothetical protein
MRVCAEPRCPTIIDGDGDWQYCEAHGTDEKEYLAAEDFVRGLLDRIKDELADITRFVETTDEPHPRLGQLVATQQERLGWLEDAIYFGGNRWLVAQRAMFAGRDNGFIAAYLAEHDLEKRIEAMKVDARRGSTVLEGASKAGKQRVKKLRAGSPSDERLCAYVTAVHTENPDKSWNWVCDEAARRCNQLMESKGSPFRLVGRTMKRRAKAADWRRR